jgi:hypothetical protein
MDYMKKNYLFLAIMFISFTMVACNVQGNNDPEVNYMKGNPTAGDISISDKDADIFMLNDVIYINAEDIELVNEEKLSLGEEVLEIKKQTNESSEFVDGVATKLNVGTKIYESFGKGDIYIALVDGKEIRYLGLREG